NEIAGRWVEQEAFDASGLHNLCYQLALGGNAAQHLGGKRCAGALFHQIDPRPDGGGVVVLQRYLLPYDRGQVGVEGEHVLLDIPPRGIGVDQREAGVDLGIEYLRVHEAEYGIHRPLVREPEAANLVAEVGSAGVVEEADGSKSEHSNLGVHVAQVGNLEDLLDALEAGVLAGAEFAFSRINFVATIAGEGSLVWYQAAQGADVDSIGRTRPLEEVLASLL